ncbi:MAG: carbamate kinase [Bacillota bacterium]|jgi:carbamate kinase
MSLIVVALGGNAILRPGQKGTYQEQIANIELTANSIVNLLREGHRVIVTHGNGPQVGNVLIQHEAAKGQVPAQPLDVCGAQTQGQIGYMIQNCLDNHINKIGIDIPVVTIITRVRVDSNDLAFDHPTKPIGPFFDKDHAEQKIADGESWMEDSGRGWRRIVPSPEPIEIIELEMIKVLTNSGGLVVAGGGGGIPVIEKNGELEGIEAVIDKDFVASRLACDIDADFFLILTDVNKVALNYGAPEQKNLDCLSVKDAIIYLEEGQFGIGSMGPKIRAAVNFVKNASGTAIITSLDKLNLALQGLDGTRIVKE